MRDPIQWMRQEYSDVVQTIKYHATKVSEFQRLRGGGSSTPPEQLSANGGLSSLKVNANLSSSGNTLTLTPVGNGTVPLYGDPGQGWVTITLLSPVTLSSAGFISGRLYDIYVYYDSQLDPPAPALEAVAWTDETNRSVALTTQDGESLKSTDTSRHLIAVCRYNGSTLLVPKYDPNGEIIMGTGDPRNNVADPHTGVGMSAPGVTFGAYVWQFWAALNGVVGVGFNALGQLLAGQGSVVIDKDGIRIQQGTATENKVSWYSSLLNIIGEVGFYEDTSFVRGIIRSTADTTGAVDSSYVEISAVSRDLNTAVLTVQSIDGVGSGASLTADSTEVVATSTLSLEASTLVTVKGPVVFNDQGTDSWSVRIESDTDPNLFYTDPLNNRIGIGKNNPTYKLDVTGSTRWTAQMDEAQGANIASATTTDIGAATGNYVKVTGTTTITGLGTIQAGTRRVVEFTGALLLTHNATSLILPGGANITTVAGDTACFVSLGSGNWKCAWYVRAASPPIVYGSGISTFLTTPSSANLAVAVTDETGSGLLVFGTSPTLTTPVFSGTPTGTVTAGTYTPTLTNTTNVAASTSAQCNYMRVGNQVTVSGRIAIDPTAAVATLLEISLPIASNFGGAADCGGVAACGSVAGMSAAIDANTTNDTANLSYIATDLANRVWTFQFMYEVI